MPRTILSISIIFLALLCLRSAEALGKIIFAVNAGGDAHVDIYGVKYQKGLYTRRTTINSRSNDNFVLTFQIRLKEK